jgi:peptide/nickel transport system permease protein
MFVLTLITYIIFFVIPSDPLVFSRRSAVRTVELRESLGLGGSVFEQYGQFVSRLVTGGALGHSEVFHQSVNEVILAAAPVTFALVLGGALLWMLIAVPLGLISALWPHSPVDRAGTVFVLLGLSLHPLWIGLVLSYVFGFRLGLFPMGGYCDFFNGQVCAGPVQWTYHMMLPWLAFALLFAAYYSRMIRAGATETMHEDFVRTARAKGASEWTVVRSHVLRVALLPVITFLAIDIGGLALGLIGSSLFIETAFGLPGLGRVLRVALLRRDLPVIAGVVLFVSFCVVFANLIGELVSAKLDPRIRLERAARI